MVGRPAREIFADRGPRQMHDLLLEVMQGGFPRLLDDWKVESTLSDGQPVRHIFSFRISPWRDEQGRVRGVVSRGREVSVQRRVRERAERRADSADAVVRTLQDVLLPEDLPVLPGLDIDSAYLLAAERAAAGGDWYDALVRPNGTVVLAAGDVVGHGAAASAVMGQLRAVLHNRLLDDLPLVEAVLAADRHADLRNASRTATLVVVEIDVATGLLSYVTAGHPRPLVVGVDGSTGLLPASGGGPLGSGSGFEVAHAELAEGEMVVLYTDGAVERPDRSPTDSADELASIVSGTYLGGGATTRATERVCRKGLELLARRTGHRDDITLLAAQRVAPLPALTLRMRAEPESVTSCRLALADWLDGTGARSLDIIALQHAVGEAVDNVVRHAYRDALAAQLDESALSVDARLLPSGEAEVVVRDHGTWQPPASGGGRGLAMARGFMDHMEVQRSSDGTQVVLRHRLTRPASLNTAHDVVPRHPGTVFGVDIDVGEVSVRGDVDARSVDELRVTLDRASHGRTSALTVDLTDVTHLGSTGVQLLFELLRDDPSIDLVARQGSVADHVLDVVHLGHTT